MPSARRRLRAEGEAQVRVAISPGSVDPYALAGRDLYELRMQLAELRARVEALEAKAGDLKPDHS